MNTGIGFRSVHYVEILETRPSVGWFEVHPENYMAPGGAMLAQLEDISAHYPLSLHAVGLSLGSPEPVDEAHLERLALLNERFSPFLVSEHLSWCRIGGIVIPDLLPVPLTNEALDAVSTNVSRVQDKLKRPILLENPSVYLSPETGDMGEADFLAVLSSRCGSGVLLDVNNIYVSASNLGLDPVDYLQSYFDALPAETIGEIHLAGHKREENPEGAILIDDHGSKVCDDVWSLFEQVLDYYPHAPVLIEWDTDIPELAVLTGEASRADTIRSAVQGRKGRGHAA